MKKSFAVLAAAGFLAVSAQAQTWDKADPVNGILAQARASAANIPAPSGTPARAAAASQSLKAVPLHGASISGNVGEPFNIDLKLVLNDSADRVGVEANVCDGGDTGGEAGPECSTIAYLFPSLTYNKETKGVYSGQTLVATNRRGLRLEKGYKLTSNVSRRTASDGFNHFQAKSLEVSLTGAGLDASAASAPESVAASAAADDASKIVAAVASGSANIRENIGNPLQIKVNLTTNDAHDRIGAVAQVCDGGNFGGEGGQECADITYVFSSLSYDKGTGDFTLGDKVVGSSRGGLSLNGYEFTYKIVPRTIDDGFNRYTARHLEIALVSNGGGVTPVSAIIPEKAPRVQVNGWECEAYKRAMDRGNGWDGPEPDHCSGN